MSCVVTLAQDVPAVEIPVKHPRALAGVVTWKGVKVLGGIGTRDNLTRCQG